MNLDIISKEEYYLLENTNEKNSNIYHYDMINTYYSKLYNAHDIITFSTILNDRVRFGYSKEKKL